MNWISRVCAVLLLLAGMSQAAELRGNVSDESGQPLAGANVVVQPLDGGALRGAATDLDGVFRVAGVGSGEYRLSATMVGHVSPAPKLVQVKGSDTVLSFQFKLEASVTALDEVVVQGRASQGSKEAALDERMDAAVIVDNLGGEQLRKLPDPDVAKVLRRATGMESMGGDPVIRGLGVRYSKVSLNNAAVSGTEPNRSSVSLSLFPAALMRNLSVSKSYSADQAGEFGGGRVNMDTWELGGAPLLSLSISTGFHAGTTFQNQRSGPGGSLDLLGFDDGSRALPGSIENSNTAIVERGQFSSIGYTADELAALSRSFDNSWDERSVTALPSTALSATWGGNVRVAGKPMNVLLTGLWNQSSHSKESSRSIFKGGVGGQIELQHSYRFQEFTQDVGLGGLAAATWEGGDWSRYRANLYYNRAVENETRFFSGWNDDRQQVIRDTRYRYVANSVLNAQASGHHVLPDWGLAEVDWMLAGSQGSRAEPDTREVQYELAPDGRYYYADETQSGSRIFGDLVDHSANLGLDLTLPLGEDHDGPRVKTGVAALVRRRDSETRFFQFELRDHHNLDLAASPEELLTSANMRRDGFLVREATRPTDSYEADHNLVAGYASLDLHPLERLRVNAGLRFEQSVQEVTSYQLFTATATPQVSRISTADWLPALNLTWMADEATNLRLGLSQTVSRPDFREMSEFEFTDIIGGHAVIGNPDLKRALIRHVDLRWERRLGPGDLVSASVFAKRFLNPIEVVIQPTAQNRVSYENADKATNTGLELEWRQQLAHLNLLPEGGRRLLQNWSLTSNLALLRSEISLSDSSSGIQTSGNRPLQGQSPYLANLGLSWEHPGWGTQVDLLYHTSGKRIVEVGARPLPDVYEMVVHELDLALRQPLGRSLVLKAGARNLLNPEHRYEQGGETTQRYREGISWSLGVSWSR